MLTYTDTYTCICTYKYLQMAIDTWRIKKHPRVEHSFAVAHSQVRPMRNSSALHRPSPVFRKGRQKRGVRMRDPISEPLEKPDKSRLRGATHRKKSVGCCNSTTAPCCTRNVNARQRRAHKNSSRKRKHSLHELGVYVTDRRPETGVPTDLHAVLVFVRSLSLPLSAV